jgi:hypothetical protein
VRRSASRIPLSCLVCVKRAGRGVTHPLGPVTAGRPKGDRKWVATRSTCATDGRFSLTSRSRPLDGFVQNTEQTYPILYPGVRPRPWRQHRCSVRRARFAPHRGLPMPWESGPRGRPYFVFGVWCLVSRVSSRLRSPAQPRAVEEAPCRKKNSRRTQLPVRTHQPSTGGPRRATRMIRAARSTARPQFPYVGGKVESIGIRRTVDR